MTTELSILRNTLTSKGLSNETRKAIRQSKICIIDDMIEDLKGMTNALKKEGFNNIIELETVESIEQLLDEKFDLVVMDLTGIAANLSKDDGYGVLNKLKDSDPFLPILVITGTTTAADKVEILKKADLLRSKPVFPAELSSDVELILKISKDEFWAGMEILSELLKINHKIQSDLSIIDKFFLNRHKQIIAKKILNEEKDIISRIRKIANITVKLGTTSLKIARIAHGIGA